MSEKLIVKYRPIKDIAPYINNARTHSKQQIRQLANSIEAFGFIKPVLIDDEGVLVAGHVRVLAARRLGLKVIPVIQQSAQPNLVQHWRNTNRWMTRRKSIRGPKLSRWI
jgi:hypothetical protein